MHNLALAYSGIGLWEEAEELGREVVAIKQQLLGKEDLETLGSMASLASTYRHRGKHTDAQELEGRVQEIKKQLSKYDIDQLSGNGNTELTLSYQRGERARCRMKKRCVMREKQFGGRHPETPVSTEYVTVWRTSDLF